MTRNGAKGMSVLRLAAPPTSSTIATTPPSTNEPKTAASAPGKAVTKPAKGSVA